MNNPESFTKLELSEHLKIPQSVIGTQIARAKNLIRLAMEMHERQPKSKKVLQTPAMSLLTHNFPGIDPAAVLAVFHENKELFVHLQIAPPEPYLSELINLR